MLNYQRVHWNTEEAARNASQAAGLACKVQHQTRCALAGHCTAGRREVLPGGLWNHEPPGLCEMVGQPRPARFDWLALRMGRAAVELHLKSLNWHPKSFQFVFLLEKKKTINNNIHAFSELPKNSQRNLAVIWHQVCTSCATCRAYISLVVAAKDLVKNKKYGVHHGFSPKRSGILQPQRCNLDRKTDDKQASSGFPSIFRQVSPTSVCLKIGVPGTPFHPLANLHRLTHPQCSQSETPWAHHNSLEVPRFEHPILGPWAMTKL